MLLGIDIGGTTIGLGLVENREIVRKVSVPSFPPGASLDETLDYLSGRIQEIRTPGTDHIGIGVPTLVDVPRGIVYNALNIPSWTEVHLKEYLEDRFALPVSVNNDANCFVLGAAARLGHLKGTVVGVTLGTGTGIGILIDGKLFAGDHCGAGELCSLPYERSILEAYCSKQFFDGQGLSAKDCAGAAEAGDPAALAQMQLFGRHIGKLLSVVMFAYDPSLIVLGGGVANAFELFRGSMMESLREQYLYHHVLDSITILSMPESDTALLGASLLNR